MVQAKYDRLRVRELDIDLEQGNGALMDEEGGGSDSSSTNLVTNGSLGPKKSCRNGDVKSGRCYRGSIDAPAESGEVLIDRRLSGAEELSPIDKKAGGEKPKKKKKPPKPPRPPKAPSMDAADQKLIKEMAELAMMKRARIERMKALKRMKNAKAASSSNNLLALVITLIFCCALIWQGLFSRSGPNLSFQGSPQSSAARGGFISLQIYNNASTNYYSSSTFPNHVEMISGLENREEGIRGRGYRL